MSSGGGTTTITQAVSHGAGLPARALSIAWRFPHTGVPPVALQWEGNGDVTLGRDPGCSVQLGGHDVSRRHAVLRQSAAAGTAIVDLGSRNGIRVNGRPIPLAQLGPQDIVRLGGWVGVVTSAPGDVVEIAPDFWGGEALTAALAPLRQVAATDLPLALQAKLLRVLEEREVQPLGEARPTPIDVRVVVAGQQSLMEAVRAGRFRGDLLARLDGLTVRLPPLRQRREDVLPLFSKLLDAAGGGRAPAFESDVAERLCVYDWPFNVRELVLLTRRLIAVHGAAATLKLQHLPERMTEGAASAPPRASSEAPPKGADAPGPAEPVQLPALIAALRAAGGNVARAAAVLGISRQRAYRLMEGQGVDLDTIRSDGEKVR